jgi:hypothetical protein
MTDLRVHDDPIEAFTMTEMRRQRQKEGQFLGPHHRHLPFHRAVDSRVGPSFFPVVEISLRRLHRFEAQAFERSLLCVPDAGFHFALAIRVGDRARQGRGVVVLEHVRVQRIERRVVNVGLQNALGQIVEHHHTRRATDAAKRFLVKLRPNT